MKKFIKEAMREHKEEVEKLRKLAASKKNRAEYYRWALHYWLNADGLFTSQMVGLVREAAALDGVELKEDDE